MYITNLVVLIVAFIVLIEKSVQIYAFRVFEVNGAVTMLALENEPISIECKQDTPMAYCGFKHPTGKRFSFSGTELIDGHCAIRINATHRDTGEWKCHIGRESIGVELMQKIQLRVVDRVAAVEQNISALHGKDVTIECATTQGFLPLSYCRFEPPSEIPFSIDSTVNRSDPILGRYYFPLNKSLDRGDCAVTIHKVKLEDVGLWTCGVGMRDGKEYTDGIKLVVEGVYTMSTASATGVTIIGVGIGVFVILLGYIGWKKRSFLGAGPREPAVEDNELREMGLSRDVQRESLSRRSSPNRSPSIDRRSPQPRRMQTLGIEGALGPSALPLMLIK